MFDDFLMSKACESLLLDELLQGSGQRLGISR